MTMHTPVIFIHGLWLHATSWNSWIALFEQAGYAASAPGWPGDPDTVAEARANPESIADHGIDDVVAHYAKVIQDLDTKPILVGHSFGGMIAQKLLGQDLAAAAVAIDAAQIKGVLPLPLSALRATLPVFTRSSGSSTSPPGGNSHGHSKCCRSDHSRVIQAGGGADPWIRPATRSGRLHRVSGPVQPVR
ncbi:alpha/beta hydrolase [Dactylosporangium sp. NPDC048998]|uniref:alpha/beta hydrolase n=1 Tax=Dactylosporangium sp. NPDC048998 TaxID=3363976 RepID=UPI0037107908